MSDRQFRGKPSKSHIIWTRSTRSGATRKRFDDEHFEKWATHCGFDFERTKHVDHDRGGEPRAQCRCVFSWGKLSDETIEVDGESWDFGDQTVPRTFIEIDEKGLARVKGWKFETIYDIRMMRHKGPELLIETANEGRKRLNGRKFVTGPREQQREDSS
ncbi:hypothetical protein [Halovenus marina]|uniref:hypothetical protein n=1 Tax=Halovenus marina TaxID=3396621 RepID=UPI003F55ABED